MTSRRPLRSFVASIGVLVLFPLACERADHDVARGLNEGDGDGDNSSAAGGASGGMMGGDGDTGGTSAGGTIFVPPGVGGATEPPALPNPLLQTCANNMGGMGGEPSVGDAAGDLLIDDFDDMNNRVRGNGLSGRWESHNDEAETAMQSPQGGFHVPESDWTDMAFDAGRDDTGSSLHMTGSGFTTWGSGQSLYLSQGDDSLACLFDASAYAGVTFWARGHVTPDSDMPSEQPRPHELGTMRFKVIDLDVVANDGDELEPGATAGGRCDQEIYRCWDSPVKQIELNADTSCWQRYVVPFEELEAVAWSKWDGDGFFDTVKVDPAEIFQIAFEVSEKQTYEVWIDDISFYVEGSAPTEETMCPSN